MQCTTDVPEQKAKSADAVQWAHSSLSRIQSRIPSNGLAATPEGLWIAEQKLSGAQAAYGMPDPKSLSEAAWLVDWLAVGGPGTTKEGGRQHA